MRPLILLAVCAVACTPDRWQSMQGDWSEPDPSRPPDDLAPAEETADPPFELPPPGEPLSLSIEQVTMLALRNNRDLAVQQLDPVIAGTFELIERGVFDPELYADLEYGEESASEVSRSTGERFDVDAEDLVAGAGVRQRLPSGTDIDVGVTAERNVSNRAPTQSEARVGLTVTQSLLRDLGPSVNLARVRQAELGAEASRFELEGFTQAVVADTQIAYWNFVLAQEEIAIFERSLEVAIQQRDDLQARIDVGAMSEDQIAVARTEVAVREQALIDARARLEERRLRLLRLISPGREGRLDRRIEASSEARVAETKKVDNVDERLQLALKVRPDLQEARLRQEEGRLETIVTRNGVLPRLDLFVTLGKSGYADSLLDAFEDLGGDGYDAAIGLSLSAYLNNRAARGHDLAARANWQRAAEAVANLAQLVRLDVRLALTELERARQQITATRTTRELQALTVAAERQRFEVGTSTGLLVAQAQRDLLQAQIEEVRAIVNYRIALVRLYLAEGSLLPRRGVAVQE